MQSVFVVVVSRAWGVASPVGSFSDESDPSAIRTLFSDVTNCRLRHLPKLHAKVYIIDGRYAIVTSANLTRAGLFRNFEVGVGIADRKIVSEIRSELLAYAELGAEVLREELEVYCEMAAVVRERFASQMRSVARKAQLEYERAIDEIETHLIRLRTRSGPVTNFSPAQSRSYWSVAGRSRRASFIR